MTDSIIQWEDIQAGGPVVPKNFVQLPPRLATVVRKINQVKTQWVILYWCPTHNAPLICDGVRDSIPADSDGEKLWNQQLHNELREHNCNCGDDDYLGPHAILLNKRSGYAWVAPRSDAWSFLQEESKKNPLD